jgi:hypothetical protein
MSYMELVESNIFRNISAFVNYDNIIQRTLLKIHLVIMFTFAKPVIYHTSLNPVPNAQVCYFNNVWFMF